MVRIMLRIAESESPEPIGPMLFNVIDKVASTAASS